MRRFLALSILVLALTAPAAAAASTTLRISASPTALRYSTSRLTAHPGLVTILLHVPLYRRLARGRGHEGDAGSEMNAGARHQSFDQR